MLREHDLHSRHSYEQLCSIPVLLAEIPCLLVQAYCCQHEHLGCESEPDVVAWVWESPGQFYVGLGKFVCPTFASVRKKYLFLVSCFLIPPAVVNSTAHLYWDLSVHQQAGGKMCWLGAWVVHKNRSAWMALLGSVEYSICVVPCVCSQVLSHIECQKPSMWN